MAYQPVEPVPAQPVYSRPTAVPPASPRTGMAALAIRVAMTLVGAALMIIGSLLDWFRSFAGTSIRIKTFIGTPGQTSAFLRSAGAITILLGLIAIVGLVPRSGWLTRLAGALGIVAWVMFVIQVYRAPGNATLADISVGAWLLLAGSIVARVAGFFGTRYRVTYTAPPPATAVVPPAP